MDVLVALMPSRETGWLAAIRDVCVAPPPTISRRVGAPCHAKDSPSNDDEAASLTEAVMLKTTSFQVMLTSVPLWSCREQRRKTHKKTHLVPLASPAREVPLRVKSTIESKSLAAHPHVPRRIPGTSPMIQ